MALGPRKGIVASIATAIYTQYLVIHNQISVIPDINQCGFPQRQNRNMNPTAWQPGEHKYCHEHTHTHTSGASR